jgi:hypothetical protein
VGATHRAGRIGQRVALTAPHRDCGQAGLSEIPLGRATRTNRARVARLPNRAWIRVSRVGYRVSHTGTSVTRFLVPAAGYWDTDAGDGSAPGVWVEFDVMATAGDFPEAGSREAAPGPSEAANNLIKRIKRIAFGFTRFSNYRVRVLLYAGRPNWNLLATITPR